MTFIYLLLELLEQKFIKKETNKKIYLFLSISLIGLAIILLAPGNTVRLTSPTSNNFANISIISKLLKSIPAIINGVFDNYSNMFINLFLIVISYISIENQKNNKNKLLNLITISNLFITLFSILNHQNYFNYFISQFESHFILALIYLGYIIQILAIIITILLYFYQHQNNLLIKIFLTSLASLTVMLVAPYYPSRSNIPFYFLNFLIIIYILAKTLNKNQIIIIAIALIAFLNYSTITYGYFQNNHINQKNDLTLKETAQKIQNKEKITTIPIQKQKYILYSGEQPYIEGNEYIEEWLKNYYALPKEITFTYYD